MLAVVFAMLLACGGRKSTIGSPLPGGKDKPRVSMEHDLANVLLELDAAQAPAGVDSALFAQLKEALRAALEDRYHGKFVATPPTGPDNEIPDFNFEDNGDGTHTFSWSYYNVGDYDQNGTINIADITPIAVHFGEDVPADDAARNSTQAVVDGSNNGSVDIADITPIAVHFGNNVTDYLVEGSETGDAGWSEVGVVDFETGVEGSRKRFLAILNVGLNRYFRLFPRDAVGTPGVGSPTRSFGPSAQADADAIGALDAQFYGVGSDPLAGNVAFLWDFESDGVWDTTGASGPMPDTDAGEQSPFHVYGNEGVYTATLRVYDSRGNWSTATVTVPVFASAPADAPPSASALALDLTGAAPFTTNFLAFGRDPDGGVCSYTWDFGDSSATDTGQRSQHTYTTPGTYITRLTVMDDEDDTGTASLTIKVCPAGYIPDMPPSATAALMSDEGDMPISMLGSGADMDEGVVTYSWDMGDNSAPITTGLVDYDYPADGVYQPFIHIWDDEGNHSSATATVVYGSPTNAAPSASVISYITSGTQNMRAQFHAWGDDPDGTIVSYSWDFDGDGVYGDFGITDEDPIVIYTAVGTWDVGVRITDGASDSSLASVRINVHPCEMGSTPPTPPGTEPQVPGTPPDLGTPINARCYPCPLSIAHGPDGGTLWLIYNDDGGFSPLAPGYPSISQIQLAGPNPVAPFLWGPQGEIDNNGNGNGGADIATPDPMAGPPPGDANLKGNETWEAYTITRPKDGPPRVERLDIKFHLKRDDGTALATQTCVVYAHHSIGQVIEPELLDTVGGFVDSIIQVDPTGADHTWNFIDVDPGDLINVYLAVDGVVTEQCDRDGSTNQWSCSWDTNAETNGVHLLSGLLYSADDPQPGEAGDPGPYWETGPVDVIVDNMPIETEMVDLNLSSASPITVTTPVDITVSTLDGAGGPVYESFFDVFYTVSPERSETMSQLPGDTSARIVQMTDNGDGTYTAPFTCDVSGVLAFSTIVVDTRTGDKVPFLNDVEYVDFVEDIPAFIGVQWDLTGYPCDGPIAFYGQDNYGNLISDPDLPGYNVFSDHPAILPGAVTQFADDPSLLLCDFTALDWARANLQVEQLPSGALSDEILVGYPPWKLHAYPADDPLLPDMPPEFADRERGMMADSFFDVFFDIRVPESLGDGWQNFEVTLAWPTDAPWTFEGLTSLLPGVIIPPPETYDDMGWTYLVVGGGTIDMSEYSGEQTVFSLSFSTLPVSDITTYPIGIVPGTFSMQNDLGSWLFFDDGLWTDFYDFLFSVKPTKTLNMHIYRVEGSATDAEIDNDVQAAEDAFNLNALLCTLGYYVDFNVTITTIPLADWNKIDEDGDGLDRYDANGDGDYADDGDNNDLFNAMNEGYFDVNADTENIYYVPGIRGGAIGTTYWPNSQVAVDNSADPDDLTLAHEKVHEMDLRKDGDFDVLDGADMNDTEDGVQHDATAEGQGAYGPGNIMNYGDTGPLLTNEQGENLDP